MMRPTLARISSAASGLRFCGMIELPVVNLSESFTKPNCDDDQITSSSAKRLRCMAQRLAALSVSRMKSRSETASSELAVGRSKPSAFAPSSSRSIGVGRAGEGGGAERAFVEALARILEAAVVAAEHFDIGEQVVAEGHRLGVLQVGEAGHDGRDFGLGRGARGPAAGS